MNTIEQIKIGQSFMYAGAFHTIKKIENDTVWTEVPGRFNLSKWAKNAVEIVINNQEKYK